MLRSCALFLAIFIGLSSLFAEAVVYSQDSRREPYSFRSKKIHQAAQATVALMKPYKVFFEGTHFHFLGSSLNSTINLCPWEKFVTQPSNAFCTGVLVAEDLILTAEHCVPSQRTCEEISFIFGYQVDETEGVPRELPADHAYHCQKLVVADREFDYSLIKLDRPVTVAEPVVLSLRDQLDSSHPLFVAGYPSGLPQKISRGKVAEDPMGPYLKAFVDTFEGNSGSPIFDAQNFSLLGILISGETDYVYSQKNQCQTVNVCSKNECPGETVLQSKSLLRVLAPFGVSSSR